MTFELSPSIVTELVCTRISHDLIGNIGAVGNAVELLEEGDLDFIDDIRSILKTSSGVLAARLKFFRLAFGLENSAQTDLGTIKEIATAYLSTLGNQNYPTTLSMQLFDPRYGRAVLLAVMLLADTLVRGGEILVRERDGQVQVSLQTAVPPSADKLNTVKNWVAGQELTPTAQLAPLFYLKMYAKQEKINIYILNSDVFGLGIA